MSHSERAPLLQRDWSHGEEQQQQTHLRIQDLSPSENPREWVHWRKMANVAVIASMSILSPLVSSMFTPGISQIADDLHCTPTAVIGTTTGFVIMLSIGPLILAPLSETFGRRRIYLICFSMFALLQIPTALAPNIAFLISIRSVAGFFGSVGIANGGGTISDMFVANERLGLGWRWVFWVMSVVCSLVTFAGWWFLRETYVPVILRWKIEELEREDAENYTKPLPQTLLSALRRPPKIFTQPIVATMSIYQALIFATTYSLYTNMQPIYQHHYHFSTEKLGLLYLGPGSGFLFAVCFLVPHIDTIYNRLSARYPHKDKPVPEFRLPLANLGAVLIPISLFCFAWTVEIHAHWFASISATFFYGIGQVLILNTTQNYFIDCFEEYAASAIAAGTVFRSVVGGVVPVFAPALFERLGYGWGISCFAFVGVALAPAPVLFYVFGERLKERFPVQL
ncbi:MFS general substrate transporter [Plenodomus tracheiphilus IPT5]|uniref:MFS general substrate transporter n=1 Tax=Plenodomus tracheiphilus IPT5 TaxID=1408161 RepID=A0A6A7B073_9PLEO|nr:MFS general substrate transporter [Plenodomus tracheiphilus IPT5]